MASEDDDLRATDLLPPDNPPPDDRPKKIAERRVVGWFMSNKLVARLTRRPAGNSSAFWKRIEEDDPFVPRPVVRRLRQDHTLYPADRIDRIPSNAPPPRTPQPQRAQPKPRQEAKPPPKPPAINPDPRAARAPVTPQTPAPTPEPAEPLDRTPPSPKMPSRSRTGRIRVSSAKERPSGSTGIVRTRSAAEIRAEKEANRKLEEPPEPPKQRKLDDVLGVLGQLKMAQEMHAKGLLEPEGADIVEDAPRPKPKRVVMPDKPAPAAPPIDRSPPKPKAPSKPAPKAGPPPSAGNMDDLFGGGGPSEGRVRIGKRSAPKTDE